jgi:hypothetical protein
VCGKAKIAGSNAILFLEPISRSHAMHKVVGGIAPFHSFCQTRGIQHVGRHDFCVRRDAVLKGFGPTRKAANTIASVFQLCE